jgi:site-specific DNA-methyltransferase (adenine-specific)
MSELPTVGQSERREPTPKAAEWEIRQGDALDLLREMPDRSAQCCVTSPPYYGLRDYGVAGQIGLEASPAEYVAALVATFAEVRRVLRDDGTLWLNLGDSYCSAKGNPGPNSVDGKQSARRGWTRPQDWPMDGFKGKDLIGIPWMVAFALRADGWFLRSDIIWAKTNPMPESVRDRPTRAHEYLFLLTKSRRYVYDSDAIREPATDTGRVNGRNGRDEHPSARPPGACPRTLKRLDYSQLGRNKRSVWTIPTKAYAAAHFATFPPALVEPCVLAGCPEGGVVLDPFAGAATTGLVALRLNRSFVGIELNPEYVEIARERILADSPMLNLAAQVAA